MKYILLAFVILTVFVGMQHAAAQNTGNTAENNCPVDYDYVQIKDNTSLSSYMIDLKYGPPVIKLGCEIEWHINFLMKIFQSALMLNIETGYPLLRQAIEGCTDHHHLMHLV